MSLHGAFCTAVSRAQARDAQQIGSIALTESAQDDAVYLSLRHADGTVLTAVLEDHRFGLLADILTGARASSAVGRVQ